MMCTNVAHLLAWCFAVSLASAPSETNAQDAPQARLAIIGSADIALYGQDGYCGKMSSFDKSNTSGVLIDAGRRTWFRLKHRRDCVGDFSFVPEPGHAYILRAGTPSTPCLAEFFRIHRGQEPTREYLHKEERRSCLLPWNHQLEQGLPAALPSDITR